MASRPVPYRRAALPAVAALRRVDGRADIARHAHSRGEKIAGVLAGITIMALVVAGFRYTVFMPSATLSSGGSGTLGRESAPDPFAQERIGRIVVPTNDGRCREYPFYNENGGFGADRVVICDDDQPRVLRVGPSAGFSSFKQAFGKK